ncbi:MAG: hypothetical protein EPO06_01120 [Burkholderiaceae bacterium]|nr:MAG: hypothetical protein EPO06_01120 [Burkholderiaceae bacterium]
MNLYQEWKNWQAEPKPQRVREMLLYVYALVIITWGVFFIPDSILRDSQTARDVVAFATSVFPWLNKIRELGAIGERALFLYSVTMLLGVPAALHSWIWMMEQSNEKLEEFLRKMPLRIVFALGTTIFFFYLPDYRHLSFLEKKCFLSQVGTPVFAMSVGIVFWIGISSLFFSLTTSAPKSSNAE